jgi:hypothetical protein
VSFILTGFVLRNIRNIGLENPKATSLKNIYGENKSDPGPAIINPSIGARAKSFVQAE